MATILVVEDNDDVRDMMAVSLQLEGHRVVTARNGQHALEVLDRGPRPCLILLDLMMPVMDGWEFQRRVAERPEFREIPIVVVSAAGGDLLRQIRSAAFLPKPIDLDRLLNVVCEFCDGTAAR
jgi:CheY-like chemotaxis protein